MHPTWFVQLVATSVFVRWNPDLAVAQAYLPNDALEQKAFCVSHPTWSVQTATASVFSMIWYPVSAVIQASFPTTDDEHESPSVLQLVCAVHAVATSIFAR